MIVCLFVCLYVCLCATLFAMCCVKGRGGGRIFTAKPKKRKRGERSPIKLQNEEVKFI